MKPETISKMTPETSARRTLCLSVGALGLALILTMSLVSQALAGITPRARTRNMPNGMRLILIEKSEQPLVVFKLVIDAGSRYDPSDKPGLADITARLLTEGASGFPGQALQRHVDSLGSRLRTQLDRDAATITLLVHQRESLSAIKLLAAMISQPDLDSNSFSQLVTRSVSGLYQLYDVGWPVLSDLAYQEFFQDQPLGTALKGTPASLQGLTITDVRDFFARYYNPQRIKMIVTGDFDTDRMLTDIATELLSIPRRVSEAQELEFATPTGSDSLRIVILDDPEASLATVGFFALGVGIEDSVSFAAQRALTHILAGHEDISLLGRKLIENRNMITALYADHPASTPFPLLRIRMTCAREQVIDVVSETLETMRLLRETRISKRELEDAKRYFQGHYDLAFETALDISERISEVIRVGRKYKYHNQALDHINHLTQADLKNTAARLFSNERLIVALVGDANFFATALADYGSVKIIGDLSDSR